jgi:hypothetical protein
MTQPRENPQTDRANNAAAIARLDDEGGASKTVRNNQDGPRELWHFGNVVRSLDRRADFLRSPDCHQHHLSTFLAIPRRTMSGVRRRSVVYQAAARSFAG